MLELILFLFISSFVVFILYLLWGSKEVPFISLYRDTKTVDVCGHMNKRQWVRLLDIFILGPVGIYIGYKIYKGSFDELTPFLGLLVIVYGVTTVLYNGSNYVKNKDVV